VKGGAGLHRNRKWWRRAYRTLCCIERWQIEAGLSGEVFDPPAPVAAAEAGVRRLPVPA